MRPNSCPTAGTAPAGRFVAGVFFPFSFSVFACCSLQLEDSPLAWAAIKPASQLERGPLGQDGARRPAALRFWEEVPSVSAPEGDMGARLRVGVRAACEAGRLRGVPVQPPGAPSSRAAGARPSALLSLS